jgi:hypothetical protein
VNRLLAQDAGHSSSHSSDLRLLCKSPVFSGPIYLPFVLQELAVLALLAFKLFDFLFGLELVFMFNSGHNLSFLFGVFDIMLCNIQVSLDEDALYV